MGLMAILSLALSFTACEEDDPEPVEALITEFAITNAGGDGDLRVEGAITDFTILVEVPFETDVTALVTDITVSEGAAVVPASGTAQDFSETRNFVVTNGDETNTYQVTVERSEPTSGVITDITLVSAVSGDEYETEINQGALEITVTYNDLQSSVVLIEAIEVMPAGTVWESSGTEDTLDLSTPQTITLTYQGEQTIYNIVSNVTEAGFNPDNTVTLIDKSIGGDQLPAIIDTENNRGAAFDGRYVFIASREDGNQIYYWDVENPGADPDTLTLGEDVISGGAWLISDIRILDGNIYVSNMVNAQGSTFKVYKWEGMDDDSPEMILEYTVAEEGVRLGDAISIIGNPPANGYIFASNFAWPDNASEFYVWNFDNGAAEPSILPIVPNEALRIGQYGRVNTIPGEPDLLLVTGAEMGIAVMDYSGNILAEVGEPAIQSRSFDPHVFEYNGGTYLSYTVNREWESQAVWSEVINISEGASIVDAISNINSTNIDEKRVFKHVFGGPTQVWVGASNGVGFSSEGKPRVMGFGIRHGFVVHEFSN